MSERKVLSLDELARMRDAGIVKDSDEMIADKRARRAEKKVKKASIAEVKQYFPDKEEQRKINELRTEIRTLRKDAVEKGITRLTLPDELKKAYMMAFQRLEFNAYRDELNNLSIEGLKLQDREVKVFTFHFYDELLERGFIDWGWIIRMLSKQYVSRYGWALLRNHKDSLAPIGGLVLKEFLDKWAEDPDTLKKWERLHQEDGLAVDMRELYPYRGC